MSLMAVILSGFGIGDSGFANRASRIPDPESQIPTLLDDLRDRSRADGAAALADGELRAVAVEERRVTAALFLRQDVDLALELRVRLDAARLGQHLPALDVVFFHAAEQDADVVAGLARVQQ